MNKKISIVLVVVFFGLVLVFLNSRGLLDDLSNSAGKIFSPVTTIFAQSGTGVTNFFSGVFNISNLQRENAELADRISELEAENALLLEVKNENESLRKDLDFVQKTKPTYLAAEVIAYDPSNIRGMVTINQGNNDGVDTGMAVVSEGFLIGRIVEVFDKYSKVMLITDPSSGIPVEIQGSVTSGIVKGQLGSGLLMEKIPQGEKVEPGDTVITSGLGGELPRGIIVGQVRDVKFKENSLFIDANIRPQAKMSNILRVLVVKR